jgi:uncharacterized protein (TIGR00661 family)
VLHRCAHEREVLVGDLAAFLLAKSIVKSKLPRANHYLITTFFFPPTRKERTSLYLPILRSSILDAIDRATKGPHVLVYQSGTSHDALVDVLRDVDAPFRIYGLRRDLDAPVTEDNLTFCPFSESAFVDDLASSRAVIAGGGFTLMGEAITLRKPMLAVPLGGQYEQVLNGKYLEKLGYGESRTEITSGAVREFLEKCPWYEERLASFRHDKNAGFFEGLQHHLESAVREGPL